MSFEPLDPTEDRTIPKLNEIEKTNRTRSPNLWNPPESTMEIPEMSKDIEGTAAYKIAAMQKTFTELLYSVGEKKYLLRPNLDFTVDVVIPTDSDDRLSKMDYYVQGGPVVHVILPICSIEQFEERIHRILRTVKDCLTTKALESLKTIEARQEKMKTEVPVFKHYDQLDGHKLEIVQEQIVTITDKTTGAVVTRRKKEDEEAYRVMIHRAKMELIVHNKLIKEVEKQQKEGKIQYAKQSN